MTWYFWLIVAALVLAVAGIGWNIYDVDEVPALLGFAAVGLSGAVLWMCAVHFNWTLWLEGGDAPAAPSRTCVVQELERVSHGKTSSDEWVCIGWAQ